jgi:uncharacterized protein
MLHEQLRWLTELQTSDSRLLELGRLRTELPAEMERISRQMENERDRFKKAQEQFDALKLHRRKRERDLDVEVERVKKTQSRLLEVKTNKEYQALLKEIDLAREANSGLEEEILLLMEDMDQRGRELKVIEQDLRRAESELSARQESIRVQLESLETEGQRVQTEREATAARVEPSWMTTYERVAKGHQGLAVVRVDGGTCHGCFVSIPPQLYNEILKSGPVVQCPFCSRFIYHTTAETGGDRNGSTER